MKYAECSAVQADGSHTYEAHCACGKSSKVTLRPAVTETIILEPAIVRPIEVDEKGNVTKQMEIVAAVTEERVISPAETAAEARERAIIGACKCGNAWPARATG